MTSIVSDPVSLSYCQQFGGFSPNNNRVTKVGETIRNPAEAAVSYTETCVSAATALRSPTDGQTSRFPAVIGAETAVIELALYCRIDFVWQKELRVRGSWTA